MECMWPTENDVLRPFAVGWVVPGRGRGALSYAMRASGCSAAW